jgi:hypothetical protein
MKSVAERRQRLDFDASWRVLKWDEADEFIDGLQPSLHQLAGGIKAADVVGVRAIPRRARTLLIAEFKDFDHPNIPSEQRSQLALDAVSDELMQGIVRKVIDTLTGATFAHDARLQRCADLEGWRPALGRSTTTLLILLCIEVPASQSVAVLAWTKVLQQRLRWLGPRTRVVVTTSMRPFNGLGVTYSV